jgi:hypothetical protein
MKNYLLKSNYKSYSSWSEVGLNDDPLGYRIQVIIIRVAQSMKSMFFCLLQLYAILKSIRNIK